jgi:serine/threonine protein kinase/WD40 repeat protein
MTERPGSQIGPYKLLELLGEGGMGMVFVAEQQQPVRRRVALKVVKPGMDSREVIARFEAERQALAMMDHPNIARVFDAGTVPNPKSEIRNPKQIPIAISNNQNQPLPDVSDLGASDSGFVSNFDIRASDLSSTGRPYFVMELVKGVPITDYCDGERLTPPQRLELFIPVCQAVQHAHQKGIIHRDLKPSNVLVSSHDGAPVVKVIDFGIAKAVGQRLSDKTIYTRVAQLIGTPLYMSPEQAGMSDLDIDTRSDVYSLGVLLYELLTGTTPFDPERLAKVAFDEMRRILREEDPPRPSTRLSTLGETLSAVSAKRRTEPRRLPALVRGDLDWIVMKALEKDRGRRYESASAFTADVRRFLAEEPVEARPPSARYRVRKFVRRHRTAVFLACFVAATLLAILINQTVNYFEIKAARDRFEAEALRATKAEGVAKVQQKAAEEAAGREEAQRKRAEDAKETLRQNLYDVETSLLQPAWDADSLDRFDQLLDRQRPGAGERDLRAFEWHFWNRQRHAEQPGVRVVSAANLGVRLGSPPVLSPDGSHLAAVAIENGKGTFGVWDVRTGKRLHKLVEGLDYRQPFVAAPLRIAFSGDGRRVALSQMVLKNPGDIDNVFTVSDLAGTQMRLRVWDTAGGKTLVDYTHDNFTSWLLGMALGPDGRVLAFATPESDPKVQGSRIHVWDVDAGKEVAVHAHAETPQTLTFSPDGARLAAIMGQVRRKGREGTLFTEGKRVLIWQVDPWQELPNALPKPWPEQLTPEAVVFGSRPPGAEGRLAILWGDAQHKRSLMVYALGKDKGRGLYMIPDEINGSHPVFDPAGSRIACGAAGSRVHVWDAKGNVLFSVRGHERTPAVAFGRDDHLVTAGMDATVKEWAPTGPHPGPAGIEKSDNFCPLAVALGRECSRLARAVRNGDRATLTVRFWDGEHGPFRAPTEVKPSRPPVGMPSLVLSADGRRLAAATLLAPPPGLQVRVWDAQDGRELFVSGISALKKSPLSALAVSADGSRVALVREGGVTAWEVAADKTLLDVKDPWELLLYVAFSPDGKRLAWSSDRRVRLWDVDPAREMLALGAAGDYAGPLAFSPDGRLLAACTGSDAMGFSEVRLWDAATGEERLHLKGEKGLHDIAFSPDGRRLATVQEDVNQKTGATVKLRDSQSGLVLVQLRAPERGPGYLRFSSDGNRLLLVRSFPSQPGADAWREAWNATPLPETANRSR